MEEQLHSQNTLNLNQQAQYHLSQVAKWGKFLAIAGFIMSGLIALLGVGFAFYMSTAMESIAELGGDAATVGAGFPSAGIGIIYIFIAVVYFFPCLYLFRFSKSATMAIDSQSSDEVATSLGQLNAFFRFVGILTIIALAFYALTLLVVIMGGMAAFMFAS